MCSRIKELILHLWGLALLLIAVALLGELLTGVVTPLHSRWLIANLVAGLAGMVGLAVVTAFLL